jgi:hypothetical protein
MDLQPPTIYVSVASYCDPMLPQTLDNCLAMARYPQNLRFGLCWQYDTAQPIDLSRFKADKRFRFSEHPIQESEGGCWARAIAQKMWEGETYTMQIDSHMVFAPGWDANLVRMMRAFPSEKPMISMITPLFDQSDDGRIRRQTHHGIRATKIADWQKNSGWAPWFDWGLNVYGGPVRNRFLSGMFVFTLGIWNEQVQQDPHHYYWGEEFALTLRSFTQGYDIFLPDEMIIWHMLFKNSPPRRHWEHGLDVVQDKNKRAFEHLRKLAYSRQPDDQSSLGCFGLGSVRDVAEFERFSGMDLKNKRAHPDVYLGRPPDPITIKNESDWSTCIPIEQYLK